MLLWVLSSYIIKYLKCSQFGKSCKKLEKDIPFRVIMCSGGQWKDKTRKVFYAVRIFYFHAYLVWSPAYWSYSSKDACHAPGTNFGGIYLFYFTASESRPIFHWKNRQDPERENWDSLNSWAVKRHLYANLTQLFEMPREQWIINERNRQNYFLERGKTITLRLYLN